MLILMISGGSGDAGFYSYVADILSDEYQVITYDGRGNSRSTRNKPINFEVSREARDAVAVLRAVGHESAYVFGNSGGAIFALEMARSHPQAISAPSKVYLRTFKSMFQSSIIMDTY